MMKSESMIASSQWRLVADNAVCKQERDHREIIHSNVTLKCNYDSESIKDGDEPSKNTQLAD